MDSLPVEMRKEISNMPPLKGYEVCTMTPVYHDEKFTHNVVRNFTVHAINEKKAREKAKEFLKPATSTTMSDGMVISVPDETIYSIRLLGRVVKRIIFEYK
jgi:hypothetical protein